MLQVFGGHPVGKLLETFDNISGKLLPVVCLWWPFLSGKFLPMFCPSKSRWYVLPKMISGGFSLPTNFRRARTRCHFMVGGNHGKAFDAYPIIVNWTADHPPIIVEQWFGGSTRWTTDEYSFLTTYNVVKMQFLPRFYPLLVIHWVTNEKNYN